MVEYSTGLDDAFAALADPTRRALLARLREGPATVSELARPFEISLAAVSKHLRVLEGAGLMRREVRGREHHCHLEAEPLREVASFATDYREFWEDRLRALDELVTRRRRRAPRSPR